MQISTVAKPRLLGIFAHPDDESFGPGGTLAKYAREGVEVHVCTVTDGNAGSRDGVASGDGDALARERLGELECACQILGAQLHLLNYADSGMEGTEENRNPRSLYQADLDAVARDIAQVIQQAQPHVIITHDPSGGYFHPDHIKTNRAVVRALERQRDALGGWLPLRLYYAVVPRSMLRWFIVLLRLAGRDPRRFGRNADVDLTQVGVPDGQIHVRVNVERYLPEKEAAGACHLSQGGGSGLRKWLPGILRRRSMRYEHFVWAGPDELQAAASRQGTDLFSGLPEGFQFM